MRFLTGVLMSLILLSCDTKKDVIEFYNTAPVFSVSSELNNWSKDDTYTNELIDSVKIGVPYKIAYKWEDEYYIHFSTNEQKGELEHLSKDSVWRDSLSLIENNGVFKYSALVSGLENFQFYISDPYGKQTYVNVLLQVFENLMPVSLFDVALRDINSPNEYVIDCSNSYDKDSHFGGSVVQYKLYINGVSSLSPDPLFYRVLQSGTYVIGLEVKDNNGQWSERLEISKTI